MAKEFMYKYFSYAEYAYVNFKSPKSTYCLIRGCRADISVAPTSTLDDGYASRLSSDQDCDI